MRRYILGVLAIINWSIKKTIAMDNYVLKGKVESDDNSVATNRSPAAVAAARQTYTKTKMVITDSILDYFPLFSR
jgi:hypothetical protein